MTMEEKRESYCHYYIEIFSLSEAIRTVLNLLQVKTKLFPRLCTTINHPSYKPGLEASGDLFAYYF